MNLPKKIVDCRKKLGMTQLDLSHALGVSRQAVSKWEAGDAVPTTDNLKTMSDLFGVSIDYLLNDDAEVFPRDVEIQSPETEEPSQGSQKCGDSRAYIPRLLVGALILAMLVAAGLFAITTRTQKQRPPTEQAATALEDSYPVSTFSFD